MKKEELELWRQHQDIEQRCRIKVILENTKGDKLELEGDMNEVMSIFREPTFIQETGLVPKPKSIQKTGLTPEPRSSV